MPKETSTGTIVLAFILIPVIFYLANFAIKKNTQSEKKALECKWSCEEKDYPGYDFKWNILSGPVCECLEQEPE